MFGIFKSDPLKKLQAEYEKVSEKAIEAQRNGNIALFAELSKKAEELGKKMDELKKDS